ncbi:hypothetical protein FHT87_005210 [Rhizobium sp. BK316]|uniref:Arc family DNA-binding protein n=1 Tax=Rhizobium sp. BK316 TaxID=2587053 RepID=UPI00161B695C|nr:Arc family DNA-binding protein [Rhizobium sp. BK316]MBB3411257.1 hypothetical protein [Rhizobium sp. BK316]
MPQHEDPRHNLRLPPELKKKLAHSAVDNGRSMNAEILSRLEKSFDPSPINDVSAALRGVLALDDADRAEAAALLSKIAAILAKK